MNLCYGLKQFLTLYNKKCRKSSQKFMISIQWLKELIDLWGWNPAKNPDFSGISKNFKNFQHPTFGLDIFRILLPRFTTKISVSISDFSVGRPAGTTVWTIFCQPISGRVLGRAKYRTQSYGRGVRSRDEYLCARVEVSTDRPQYSYGLDSGSKFLVTISLPLLGGLRSKASNFKKCNTGSGNCRKKMEKMTKERKMKKRDQKWGKIGKMGLKTPIFTQTLNYNWSFRLKPNLVQGTIWFETIWKF